MEESSSLVIALIVLAVIILIFAFYYYETKRAIATISCRVILIPSPDRGVGGIVRRPSDGRLAIVNELTIDDPQKCESYDLYILSKLPAKTGDYVFNERGLCQVLKDGDIDGRGVERIVASTSPDLNLPNIPDYFKKAFVASDSGISNILVEVEELECIESGGDGYYYEDVKKNENGDIVIYY